MSKLPTRPEDIDWKKYKVRTCLSMHQCALCGEIIGYGIQYYDGGHGRRAHLLCAQDAAKFSAETGGE